MRKLIITLLFLAAAAISETGCAYVTSSQPGFTNATGEAWYTKDKYVLFINYGTDIYYCPAGQQGVCSLAKMK